MIWFVLTIAFVLLALGVSMALVEMGLAESEDRDD